MSKDQPSGFNKFVANHPIITNLVIIILVAVFGLCIAYLSLTLFTKHGQKNRVPDVVGIGYTEAIEKLHDSGFKIEIRDSLYLDNVKPGLVVEQYPNAESMVKPGRKVFLYINAVYPKQVVIDPSPDHPGSPALYGFGMRQSMAILEEAGFKNIKIVYLRGDNDRVARVLANGKVVRVMEKVPVNAAITLEVYDNSRQGLTDSIQAQELWIEHQNELDTEETTDEGFVESLEETREAESSTERNLDYIEY